MKRLFFLLLLAVSLLLMAASPLDGAKIPLFEGMSSEEAFLLLVGALVGFTQGFFKKSPFAVVKDVLKLSGNKANVFIYALSTLLAVAAMYVVGAFDAFQVSAQSLIALASTIYGFSQLGYRAMESGKVPKRKTK